MNLPQPISDFFAADAQMDGSAPIDAFTPGAVVTDEGQAHVGHEAIAGWWRAAKRKYRHVAEPLEMHVRGSVTEVRAMVRGAFPGSPAALTFIFGLDGDLIASLKIGA